MFNISLNPKKSILCIFLLTVLSACSANTQGKNDAELNFEWYDTKQEANEALARFVKPEMPINDAVLFLKKSGFTCKDAAIASAKEYERMKQYTIKEVDKEEKQSKRGLAMIESYERKDKWNHDFPKTDFDVVECYISKSEDFFNKNHYGLTWEITIILNQQDKTKIDKVYPAFNSDFL